jgi:hypothetical protein
MLDSFVSMPRALRGPARLPSKRRAETLARRASDKRLIFKGVFVGL